MGSNFVGNIRSIVATTWKTLQTPVPLDFGFAANRKNYNRVLRYGILLSVILHFLLFLLIIKKPEDTADIQQNQKDLLALNPHVFEVLNARPRASLAKQMIKIPKITEVQVDLDSVAIPKLELGALDIGTDVATGPGVPGGEGSPGGGVYSRRPELVMLVPPVYPKDAEKNRIEGSVELRIHVTESGIVDNVEVQTSSGISSMDDAAVKAALKTRFRPAIKNGHRVAMWIAYPIQFALNKK